MVWDILDQQPALDKEQRTPGMSESLLNNMSANAPKNGIAVIMAINDPDVDFK